MRRRRDTQTDTQTRVTTIYFAYSTTHAKRNQSSHIPHFILQPQSVPHLGRYRAAVFIFQGRRLSLDAWLMIHHKTVYRRTVTRPSKRKGTEEFLYGVFLFATKYTQSDQAWITQFYLQITPCLPFLRERSPDGTTTTAVLTGLDAE